MISPETFPDRLVAVGRLLSPHGLKGHIKAESHSWDPDRLGKLREVILWSPVREETRKIVEAIPQPAGWRLRFEGISEPETAKLFNGCWVCVPAEKATRPKGGWIEADIIGMPMVDETNAVLGTCKGLPDLPLPSLSVTGQNGKIVIFPLEGPLAPQIDLGAHVARVEREVWDALS